MCVMTSCGFSPHSTSSVRPHFLYCPGLEASRKISASLIRRSSTSFPAGVLTFSFMVRMFLLSSWAAMPGAMRLTSCPTALSTQMTSAPRSAISDAAKGPARDCEQCTTLTPFSGPKFGMSVFLAIVHSQLKIKKAKCQVSSR